MTLTKRKRSKSNDQGQGQPFKKQKITQVVETSENGSMFETITESTLDQNKINHTDEGEEHNHEKLEAKPIDDRINDLFANLNSEEASREYLALTEIERGCIYAMRVRSTYYENEQSGEQDKSEFRLKTQQQSILFRFLSLSPNCVELMSIWEKRYKEHNKKICGRIMEILALIVESNYFLTTRKSSLVISRTVVKDKLRLIYAGFSGAFSPKGNYNSILKQNFS